MPVPSAPPGTVDEIACDYARLILDRNPGEATALGLHERDGDLPPVTSSDLDALARGVRELRERASALEGRETLTSTGGASSPC